MKIWVLIANYEHESNEWVVGAFRSVEAALEAKDSHKSTGTGEYTTIHECELV